MANSRYYQFLYSKHANLTMVNGVITFGASGAVSAVSGKGIYGVTKLATGIYQIKLTENYGAFVGFSAYMYSGVTGSNVTDGSFITGTLYQITALGTTNWAAIGLDSNFTPAVGQVFVATGAGGSGGGTAKALAPTGIAVVEMAQMQAGQLQNNTQGQGSAFIVQTLNVSDAAANPANGAMMGFKIWVRNSSVAF